MGFFDDVVNTVKKTVSTASNTVNQAAASVGKGADSTVKSIGRSDIGKAVESYTAPTRNLIKAGEATVRGDLQGAAGNILYAYNGRNPINMAIGSSSTLQDFARNDTVNTITMGYSNDAVNITDRSKEASYGSKINATDWSIMGRQAVRGALLVGAAAAAPAVYSSATGLASGATVTGTVSGLSTAAGVANAIKSGDASRIAESILPGSGQIVREISSITNNNTTPGQVTQVPGQTVTSGISTQTMLLIGGGIVSILAIGIILKNRG